MYKITVWIVAGIVLVGACAAWMGARPDGDAVASLGAEAITTEKVIVVMIDGLRLQDSYKAGEITNALRPAVDYTPRFTAEMLPLGTLYPNAVAGAFGTQTTPCTNNLVTGVWHEGPNRGRGLEIKEDDYVDNRSFERNLFERARAELGLPQDKIAFITDKLNTRISEWGYHPRGGEALAPIFHTYETRFNGSEPLGEETFVDPLDNSMVEVVNTAYGLMDSTEPDLMFLCLGVVDIAGHRAIKDGQANFALYSDSILAYDDLIVDFWNQVQSRPAYAGKTTMIVTADHGRHEDHGGQSFGEHQGTCFGSRNIIMYAIGPDTPQGLVANRSVYQVDVAPTVARLLGMTLPESTGRPMWESIGITTGLEHPNYIKNTEIAIDDDGNIHAVYRRAHPSGGFQIAYQQATAGLPFETPIILENQRWNQAPFLDFPNIVVDGSNVHVVAWRWNDTRQNLGENHEYVYWKSADGGTNFPSTPTVLATGRTEESVQGNISLGQPDIFIGGDQTHHLIAPTILYPTGGNMSALLDIAGPTFEPANPQTFEDIVLDPRRIGHHRHITTMEDSDGDIWTCFSILQIPEDTQLDPFRATWEIYVKDLSNNGPTIGLAQRLTTDNIYPYVQPAAAMETDGGIDRMHIVYAGREAQGFQLFSQTSVDLDAGVWSTNQLTSAPQQAWEPSIAYYDGIVHLVYTRFDGSQEGEIYYTRLVNGTPTITPVNLSNSAEISRNPSIVIDETSEVMHVVWEEQVPGQGFRLAKFSASL